MNKSNLRLMTMLAAGSLLLGSCSGGNDKGESTHDHHDSMEHEHTTGEMTKSSTESHPHETNGDVSPILHSYIMLKDELVKDDAKAAAIASAQLHTDLKALSTTNLLEELRIAKDNDVCDPVIVSVSSSEVYGNVLKNEVPITEKNPIRAANPYSISKVGHDLMSQYYHKAYGLKVIITRMFSHEGKRRGKIFALSSFAYQIVQNEKGLGDYGIKHGNLDSVRTYNHIDDAVHAYWLAVDKCELGEVYNIGGNYTCTVGDALDMLISKSTVKDKLFKVLDSNRVRPTDITLQIPDSTKFREATGWKPTKDLTHICDDLLNYWREVL